MDIRELREVKGALQEAAETSRSLITASRDKNTYTFAVYRGKHPRANNNEMYYHLVDLSTRRTLCYMRDLNNLIKHARHHGIDDDAIVLHLRHPIS